MIAIKDILEYMESGKPFSCTVISYDRNRKTGGEEKEYPEAILVKKDQSNTQRPQTAEEQQRATIARLRKNPHHRKWYTRNIRILQDSTPTSIVHTIHPPLIIQFNGQKVVP